jgi:hypothetical protein
VKFTELHNSIRHDNIQELAAQCDDGWKSLLMKCAGQLGCGHSSWPAHRILVQLAMESPPDSQQSHEVQKWMDAADCEHVWMKCRTTAEKKATPADPSISVHAGKDYL